MGGTGQTIVSSGGTLNLSGSTHLLHRTLVNQGTANWTSGDLLMFNGTLTNSGTFTANSDSTLSSYDYQFPGGTNAFNNSGTFIKQGTGTTQFLTSFTGVSFNNTGTVNVQAGRLALTSGGTHTGDFSGASGATLQFGNTHTFAVGADITGAVSLQIDSGANTYNGLINATGGVTFQGGTHDFATGHFNVTGAYNFTGGTVTFADPVTPTTLGINSGTVTFNAAVNY